MKVSQEQAYRLRKLMKKLEEVKARSTELVSLLISY
jgi:peptide subunit release factor 1 (eRF1)